LTSNFLEAQELPPIQNYSSNDYHAENQNWSISQSDEKLIYAANNSGLLEFNGARWRLYPSPNNSILRAVKCVENKIYTGAYMEFGFWKRNDFGTLIYTSLSEKLKDTLIEEDFWNIINFEDFILFQSLRRIYIYNTKDETFNIIDSKTQIPKIFLVDDSIYYQKLNEGVFKIEKGNSVLISSDPVLKSNILVNIIKINKKILFQTQLQGFYFLNNKEVEKWEISTNNLIANASVYSSLQLKDGSIVLGTISNGIYQIDTNGDLLNHINQEKGLNNNTILSMFEDVENNLWLGLDNGVSCINFNSPFKIYNDINGKLGAVYTAVQYNNYLYLGTNQGLFYKKFGTTDDYKFVNGTDGQVWCFKIFDNTLFCGHNKGTFVVDNGQANLITDVMGTMAISSLDNNKNFLIQGYYGGLNMLEKVNNKWQFRNIIEGFTATPRFIEFTPKGEILICHEYKGVIKLQVDKDFRKVLNYKVLENTPKSLKSTISTYNGEIIYSYKNGIFKYNNKLSNFEMDTILTNDFYKDDDYISGRMVVDDKNNTIWGFTNKSIIYFKPGKLNSELKSTKIYISASLRRDLAGFESVLHLHEQTYLFGSSDGYFVLDLNKINEDDFSIKLNTIEKNAIDEAQIQVSLNNDVKFKNSQNNVAFKYSVSNFNKFKEVNYQYQLVGIYNQWSPWSKESEVAFKNLPYGTYTFKVKAQIGNRISSNIAIFTFTIDTPWYLSNGMIMAYIVLFIILSFLIHTLYKSYYTKQKKQLIEKKHNEFTLSQLENEKLIINLQNDKLQQEIDSKTRELANSTMSIIKKNELLNSIKSELLDVKDESKVKPVIKIINKNLTNTSDWEMFQEAFNNADNDFLKRVKTAHPTLTPNDLRLCAYLRLNLSSKEIAPLLNISPRSVEIKRYRLRKKLALAHEKSLVEYILEV
jgi:DNA-binding CsgD family transcriptional regulator